VARQPLSFFPSSLDTFLSWAAKKKGWGREKEKEEQRISFLSHLSYSCAMAESAGPRRLRVCEGKKGGKEGEKLSCSGSFLRGKAFDGVNRQARGGKEKRKRKVLLPSFLPAWHGTQ